MGKRARERLKRKQKAALLEESERKVKSVKTEEEKEQEEVERIENFKDARLSTKFKEWATKQGFEAPTQVQQLTWPVLLKGESLLSVAPTGSGKTLGYLVPILSRLSKTKQTSSPRALVLAPTRELAQQIHRTSNLLKSVFQLKSLACYGGQKKEIQSDQLDSKEFIIDIVVGTPGRTKDLIQSKKLELQEVTSVVFDEYDRMCALGFAEDVKYICDKIRVDRQTVFTSATGLKGGQDGLKNSGLLPAGTTLKQIVCGAQAATTQQKISKNIKQVVHVCAEHKKPRKLIKFLGNVKSWDAEDKKRQASRILVFCTKIKTVTFLFKFLLKEKIKVGAIHGKMKQPERERALKDFKAGKLSVLVATDVAGRGIHINSLPYIVNYTFPGDLDTYIHRVGRTGRANSEGHAYSFFTTNFKPLAEPLVKLLESCDQDVDPNLRALIKKD